MRLHRITLQNFRNIGLADLTLEGNQQFFVGANAQGKTNLLEAVGYMTALRSFRANESKLLVAEGQTEAAMGYQLEHERFGATQVTIRLRSAGKEVTCDGEKVTRVGEYLGRFPTVVFSSQDQQLIRGSPSLRRRWLDLTLAAMDGGYLRALQQYHRALTERNALLKRGTAGDVGQLEAFEQPLAAAAAEIVTKREEGVRIGAAHVLAAYSQIARSAERAEVTYEADALARTEAEWLERFAKSRSRDQLLKSTSVGPHRDDFGLQIDGRAARDFGSEGQQRSLVIALRLAQLTYFRERASVEPILLADDVLGELDPQRRERFWESIGHTRQVIATGTRLPEADLGRWQIFQVENGTFTPAGAEGVR